MEPELEYEEIWVEVTHEHINDAIADYHRLQQEEEDERHNLLGEDYEEYNTIPSGWSCHCPLAKALADKAPTVSVGWASITLWDEKEENCELLLCSQEAKTFINQMDEYLSFHNPIPAPGKFKLIKSIKGTWQELRVAGVI